MTTRILPLALLASAALAAAACDGRGTTGPSAPLTQADAASLSRAVFAVGAGFADGSVPAGARGNRTVLANGSSTFSFSFNTSQPCVPAGSVGLSGAVSGAVAGPAAQVQVQVAVQHDGCTVQTDNGAFKLTGDPRIDVALTAAADASGLTAFHATEKGAFTWERGSGSSGRCAVDVTADLVPGTQNVRLSGTFCGFAVDQTAPAHG
ncbi:MAG TPA: hypothetical protein VGO40_03705 [Longimicrobium sp.]|jgi:hypothetical protein|nr:hypothetical protein [Longimicrobium sp.]